MNLISKVTRPVADDTLHFRLSNAWHHQSIRVRAELEPVGTVMENGVPRSAQALKVLGCLRGKISLAPDFYESLEDFKDYHARP